MTNSRKTEESNKMKKNISFEQAITELEEITEKLDGGALSLDESIEAFEKAVKLVKLCNEKLDAAEQRVRILTEAGDGTVTDLPFDVDKNEA